MASRRFRYDRKTKREIEVGKTPAEKAPAWTSPLHCEALAVQPHHVKFQRQVDQDLGVGGTHYDKNGSPVFESPGKYASYMKAHGYRHRSTVTGKSLYNNIDSSLLARALARFQQAE